MGGESASKRRDPRPTVEDASPLPYEVAGIMLVTLSVLILLSLVSFSPGDVPLFGDPWQADPSSGAPQTHNLIGKVGATVALWAFRIFGGGAYVVPVLLAVLGLRLFVEQGVGLTVRSVLGSATLVLSLSALLELRIEGIPTFSSGTLAQGWAGGVVGAVVAGGLERYFATTGAHILIIAGVLVSLVMATPFSLGGCARRLPIWCGALKGLASGMAFFRREGDGDDEAGFPFGESARKAPKPNKPLKIMRSSTSAARAAEDGAASPAVISRSKKPLKEEKDDSILEVEDPPMALTKAFPTDYRLPDPRALLSDSPESSVRLTDQVLAAQSQVLTRALQNFGIEGKVTEVHPGPVITMYEVEPGPGVKVSRIVSLADDLALALKAASVRIVAPLPGKSVVGIEVPNPSRETVALKDVLTSETFRRSRSKLSLALGKDIFGRPVVADLRSMPHLLVAGSTGAGKSVGLNSMVLSMMFSARPDEVKLLLIDPKVLELQIYEGIPHLLRPVITSPKAAARGLAWAVQEMERRYKLLAEQGVRNIDSYNRKIVELHGENHGDQGNPAPSSARQRTFGGSVTLLSEEERLSRGEGSQERGSSEETPPAPLPYIVVVIDEFADLMMVAPKDVEDKITRLAQMARASGIHLILATQRPSVDVVTGLIKANFPSRIAYQVSSKTDSRTILDANGAEALLGRGDMLYLASGTGRLNRLHGSFVSDEDVRQVVEFCKEQAAPSYHEDLQALRGEEAAEEEVRDEMYEQAKELVILSGQASASLVQRRLRVGYPRAARMIERMEAEGIVGAPGRDGRREILVRRVGAEGESA